MSSYLAFRPPVRVRATLSISPDGTMVAYADDRTGQFNLTVAAIEGSETRILTSFTEDTFRRVAWYPDGQQLVFVADLHGNENSRLYLIGAESGEPQALTFASNAQHHPAIGNPISPDGRLVAYATADREPAVRGLLQRIRGAIGSGRLTYGKFAGAAVYFGPANLVTLAEAKPPTWRTLVERVIGNPEADYDLLMSRSPVTYCDNIRSPLLPLQGRQRSTRAAKRERPDCRATARARNDGRLSRFPDAGHGFMKTANDISAHAATADFFFQHLAS